MMEPNHHIFAHNAGVLTLFKKEIPPLSNYTIQTRIWTWNEKWLWLQHRFVLPKGVIACVAASKLVFKKTSGKTVPPRQVFELCGHNVDDPAIEQRRQQNWEIASHLLKVDALFSDPYDWDELRLPSAKL